jgi:hypothetical protein
VKAKKKPAKKKSAAREMPKFHPIDEEMKELSAMMEKEVSDWPGVAKKPMFGMQGMYRNGAIFAALPRTRAIRSPRCIMLKFTNAPEVMLASAKKDSRINGVSGMTAGHWLTFELDDTSAMKDALGWIGRAYEATKK